MTLDLIRSFSFPAGTNPSELQQACPSPFPVLATDRECPKRYFKVVNKLIVTTIAGQATVIPECPDGDTNLADCPS